MYGSIAPRVAAISITVRSSIIVFPAAELSAIIIERLFSSFERVLSCAPMTHSTSSFSRTVAEADLKFRRACVRHHSVATFHRNPHRGSEGEVLQLGLATIGRPDAPKRLLIISGTHGVEGFGGAGVQTGWLNERAVHHRADDVCVVLVHALNPWGMSWNRRENEDNVDLFRNLLYCEHPSEADPLFDAVDDAMALSHWPERRDPERRRIYRELIERYGQARLLAAVRRGQHHRPKAMTYHGNGPTWSTQTLRRIVDERLAGATHVAVIDLHTGFGEYGSGTVMSYDLPGSDKHNRVAAWFDGDIYTPGSDADIPDHRTQLPFQWIESRVPGASVTAAILEFGTYPPEESRDCFPANHYFHLFGDPRSEEGREWAARYRRFSYPEEVPWEDAVLTRSRGVIARTLGRLRELGWRCAGTLAGSSVSPAPAAPTT